MDGDTTPPLATGSLRTPSVSPVATDTDPETQSSPRTLTTSGHADEEDSSEPMAGPSGKSKKKGRGWKAPSVRSGFSKMKAAFSKKGHTPMTSETETGEDEEEIPVRVTGEPPNPTMGAVTHEMPPYASPDMALDEGVTPLKTSSTQTLYQKYFTFGNFLDIVLIFLIFLGILFCFLILADSNFIYLGPMALGLGTFALIGKLYYTSFWWGKSGPQLFKPVTDMYEKYLGGTKDPYNLKSGNTGYTPNQGHGFSYSQGHTSVEMQPMLQYGAPSQQSASWEATYAPMDSDL